MTLALSEITLTAKTTTVPAFHLINGLRHSLRRFVDASPGPVLSSGRLSHAAAAPDAAGGVN